MDIKKLVDRFLCWKLPSDFAPDAGISFFPLGLEHDSPHWPTGTNLLHAGQAEEMFRHCLAEPTNFQERVIAEKGELDEKIVKLRAFLNSPKIMDLPKDERDRLTSQLSCMDGYSSILGQRIAAFA